jgi:ABC-type transport system substrate-binding protein
MGGQTRIDTSGRGGARKARGKKRSDLTWRKTPAVKRLVLKMMPDQATELDVAKRTAMLQRIQQIAHERSIYAPIWQLAFNGQGKRVGESGLGLIRGHAFSAPYEDVTIKDK